MNLKEEMFLVNKYHLRIEIMEGIKGKDVKEYREYLRKNKKLCCTNMDSWKEHLRDKILNAIFYSRDNSIIMGREERTISSSNLYFDAKNKNKIVYFNDLTKAELEYTMSDYGTVLSIEKEWVYSNGFKTILTVRDGSDMTKNICSMDFLVEFLESEDIKQGNKDLIKQYQETKEKPEELALPCYDILDEEQVKIVF